MHPAIHPAIRATRSSDSPLGESGDEPATGRRGRPRGGWLVGPPLALVFLGYPISAVLASDPTPARAFLVLGGAALFAGVFLWLMWLHEPLPAGPVAPVAPAEVLERRAAIAFLAALVVALNLVLGTEWLVFFFHLSAAAGLMLPRREAYVAIVGLAAVASAIGFTTGLVFLALPTAAVGLWAIAFAGQVAAVAALRAAREELARRAVAEERLRFARDLHDLLGHSLSLITLKSELAGRLLPGAPERAAKEIREAEEAARRALREVREAVSGYRQPTLGEELIGARDMLQAAGIACRIENGAGRLPKPVDAVLAWAVREGATNVVRHSRARHCTVRIGRGEGAVCAEIEDDGLARPPAGEGSGRSTDGSGLSGLAERVASIAGAELEAGPLPEGGFRLRVRLRIEDDATPEEGGR
jgi:two-component system, NarL family, sensor histidine kinase DesK